MAKQRVEVERLKGAAWHGVDEVVGHAQLAVLQPDVGTVAPRLRELDGATLKDNVLAPQKPGRPSGKSSAVALAAVTG
jgi:hypothetical protein